MNISRLNSLLKKINLKRFYILGFILFLIFNKSFSQIGGSSTFQFLNLTNSARIAGIGGDFLPIKDNDISLALSNPSVINKDLDNNLTMSYVDYFADVKMGFASYSKTFKKLGSFALSAQFVNYGTFTQADNTGQILGDFSANENAFGIGWGRELDSSFSIGANIKSVFSQYETYKAFSMAVDVAGNYISHSKYFNATFIAKNIGRPLKTYTPGNVEPLPFELETGCSFRLPNAPLRLYALYEHLEKFDLTYNDPNNPSATTDPLTGQVIEKSNISKSLDKFMRHMVFGGEFIPVKYFSLRLGYNYERRKELGVDTKLSTVGFSWGFTVKISKFNLSYSRDRYHLAGSPNNITISTNINDFFSKRTN